jgi:hypothetical protein
MYGRHASPGGNGDARPRLTAYPPESEGCVALDARRECAYSCTACDFTHWQKERLPGARVDSPKCRLGNEAET